MSIFGFEVERETKLNHYRVVVNASALPDPSEVDYDILLSCVLLPPFSYSPLTTLVLL